MPEGDTLHRWARSLDAALAGKTLVHAVSTRAELSRLIGHRVVAATAQGKHLLIEFDEGHVLRTHLRMHGTLRLREGSYSGPLMNPHVRWLLSTEDKTALCLDAPTVELLRRGELETHPVLSRLGPDVLREQLDVGEILRRLRERPGWRSARRCSIRRPCRALATSTNPRRYSSLKFPLSAGWESSMTRR